MLLKKHKVEIIEGEAFFVDDKNLRVIHPDSAQTYSFNNAIVATGSRPIEIPGFKFGGRVIDSTGGLALEAVPEKLVIIGGGVIGAELGGAYANLGAEVTIIEGTAQILPTYEKDMVQLVEKDFKEKGIKVVTSAMAREAVDNGDSVTVRYEVDGKEESVDADYVMVTVGRRPNTNDMGLEQAGVEMTDRGLIKVDKQGRTNVPSIYAIGDIVPGAALAHKASYEAKIAAEAISGKKVAVDYKAMPAVAFTDNGGNIYISFICDNTFGIIIKCIFHFFDFCRYICFLFHLLCNLIIFLKKFDCEETFLFFRNVTS